MDDDRLSEKIEIVKRVLSDAIGSEHVEHVPAKANGHDELHLFRAGPAPSEHHLWISRFVLEDFTPDEIRAQLCAAGVPTLFAATARGEIVFRNAEEGPLVGDSVNDAARVKK